MQDIFDDLYEKSKQGKTFGNLLDIITREQNILLAYRTIKRNKGSKTAGVNRRTIIDWETKEPEQYIEYVRKRLQNFFPHKVKRVEIPKADGRLRPLGIPTMEDRLIQQCIKQVLDPVLEAKFHPMSFGFRPNRSTSHAVSTFIFRMNRSKADFVVDIDIKGFFDNVNHEKLLKQLWTLGIRDKRLLTILSKMLKAEIEGIGKPDKGTPQGGILSPLLANVVLNELDWWIDSQWMSFQTPELTPKYNVKGVLNKGYTYTKLRRDTTLKEMYIVRYADDFKILCREKEDAEKAFIAIKLWLKDRLGLEVNEEKSQIVDVRFGSSEFLGFRFKKKQKNKKWVVFSHLTEKSKSNAIETLKKGLEVIKHSPTEHNVYRYNSKVLGLQNYYKMATHVNLDFGKIDYKISKFRYSKIKGVMSEKGNPCKLYKATYKGYNYKKQFVAGVCLFPVPAVRHVYPTGFTQQICDYTVEGRNLIHEHLRAVNMRILHYLMENPPINGSLELTDNRISLYSAQLGRCFVTREILEIGDMECHHKLPKERDGTDEYNNLVWVTHNVHELIHATRPETIEKYLKLIVPNKDTIRKLNILRETAGNIMIT